MSKPLSLWLYGTRVADLEEGRSGISLTWTRDAYERWGENSRVMSNLLPISATGSPHPGAVKAFVDGLLPEGNARVNYAIAIGRPSEDTYGLIERYGRDTAGALVFQPPNEPNPVRVGHYEPITPEQAGQKLLDADRRSPTDQTQRGVDSISLAGMQPKIGLHRTEAGWAACKDGAPSTWIVKLAHPADLQAADVDTEAFAIELARRIGLTTIQAEVVDLGGVRAIAVSRYDRTGSGDDIGRIHQEDLAQSLGLNTSDPNRKFQRGNALPSLKAAADALLAGGSDPDRLLALVTFNHVIGNTDFHAKNISFIRRDDGTATLAPAYDTAMHMHHQGGDRLSALDINGKYRMVEVQADDLVAEGTSWGLPPRRAHAIVADTTSEIRRALDEINLDRHPGVTNAAIDTVRSRVIATQSELGGGLTSAALSSHGPEPTTRSSEDVYVAHRLREGRPVTGHQRRGPRR